ncbi:MAG TPA: TIGR04290 family methyltransferase [Ramlibacter sp.]|jgi:tRNA (mo5U34)-methyltransferase|nr:TIGR04290 family methyltransferase [Ramlibacter sp.]
MRLIIFGLTVSSSWGNGHATLWRGLWRALARRGHHITFFERDVPYYADHRDVHELPGGELVLYKSWDEARERALRELRGADVAMVTSYCPDGVAACDLLVEHGGRATKVFYDMDTPVTLENVRAGEKLAYIGPRGLADYDLVLSYTGGRSLDELQSLLGAKRVATLYGHVDPGQHHPVAAREDYRCALSYLGTYAADRQAALEALFIEPARQLPEKSFLIGGAQYPSDFPWTSNIRFVRHMPPSEHPAFFSSSRLTLSVTRRAMADNGWCPSGRLFEAAACGTPVVSDWWEGLESFFTPGREIVVARTTQDVVAALQLGDAEIDRMARDARDRTLAEHTSDRRAEELERHLAGAGKPMGDGMTKPATRQTTWGIIPAAGMGTRIQPLGFSKELLPVGSSSIDGVERPRAVSEFLVERMLNAGANRIAFVVGPGKSDIVQYYGSKVKEADLCYVVQPKAGGLCDAIFRACPLIRGDEMVLVGLPDTIWFPDDGLAALPDDMLSFLLFPVERPQAFDAVVTDDQGFVLEIQVKHPDAKSNWIWGAFKMPGHVLHELHALWQERQQRDEYIGTLVNAYIQRGGRAKGVRRGEAYVDVGTLHGYREALQLLNTRHPPEPQDEAKPTTICSGAGTPIPSQSATPPRPVRRNEPARERRNFTRAEIEQGVRERGDWFQNLDLYGVRTAPAHFLGDFPTQKWKRFSHVIPEDLSGKSVLDIGCNAGFYSFEMKKRGASRVVGIEVDDYYLDQARFAAEVLGHEDIEFRKLTVYDVGALREKFDLVLFMGMVYHLRHPLLALDLIHEHVAGDLMVYQSLQRGSPEIEPVAQDYDFWETEVFDKPGFPRLHFIEHKYSHDETNWWVPNAACSAAMLRSAGFRILAHPEEEVFLCKRAELPPDPHGLRAVHAARPPLKA